jgi:hypothetical protein
VTCAERLGHDWRRRAAELERVAARGGTSAWLARIRLRILRFLLARYPTEIFRAPPPPAPGSSARIARTPGAGRPPMQPREMRRLLEHIHEAVRDGSDHSGDWGRQ